MSPSAETSASVIDDGPEPLREAPPAAMEVLAAVLVDIEREALAVEGEAAVADAVAVAADDRAHVAGASGIILDAIEPEDDALRSLAGGHDEIADDRPEGDDLRDRPGRRGERHLLDALAAERPERRSRHAGPIRSPASRAASRTSARSEPRGPRSESPSGAPLRCVSGIATCGTPERPDRHRRLMARLR